MNLNLRGDKIELDDEIKEYASEKIQKVSKFIKQDNYDVNFLFKDHKNSKTVELTIPLNSIMLRAEATEEDFKAGIDVCIDLIIRQLRKNKTKLLKNNKESFKHLEELEDTVAENKKYKIVKRKKVSSKPMDEEEAIMQMELIDHDFFIYKDSRNLECKVVYKRKDGDYGLIEIE